MCGKIRSLAGKRYCIWGHRTTFVWICIYVTSVIHDGYGQCLHGVLLTSKEKMGKRNMGSLKHLFITFKLVLIKVSSLLS
jgi:hypothetical protein